MAQTSLASPDVYGRTFQLDKPTLAVIADRLEARGKHAFSSGKPSPTTWMLSACLVPKQSLISGAERRLPLGTSAAGPSAMGRL
jgi:hypothetical protein